MNKNSQPLALIDTGFCNLSSVKNALTYLEFDFEIVKDFNTSSERPYSGFVLPGVGAFKPAITCIRERNLDQLILKLSDKGLPGLGICLGMQLMAKWSVEGGERNLGLGLFDCGVEPLDPALSPVPHIGWTKTYSIGTQQDSSLNFESNFYYVHSFVARSNNNSQVVAYFKHGNEEEISALRRDNILAVQFHPEKSQAAGLSLINSFFKK